MKRYCCCDHLHHHFSKKESYSPFSISSEEEQASGVLQGSRCRDFPLWDTKNFKNFFLSSPPPPLTFTHTEHIFWKPGMASILHSEADKTHRTGNQRSGQSLSLDSFCGRRTAKGEELSEEKK